MTYGGLTGVWESGQGKKRRTAQGVLYLPRGELERWIRSAHHLAIGAYRHSLDDLLWGYVVEVAAGGCERAVAKLALDDVHGHALAREFSCVGVAQAMGMNTLLDLSTAPGVRAQVPPNGGR